jgi:phage terminase large subunit-like protein
MLVHKYQKKVIDSKARFVLALAGWQGGKTTAGALKLIKNIDEDTLKWYDSGRRPIDRPKYWIVGPNLKILNEATIPKFLELLPDNSYDYRAYNMTITIKDSGVVIQGKSAHRPQTIEAATINGIWADEPGLYKREVWNKLRPRINIRGGFIIFTTTPYALSWIYDEIYLKWLEGDPDFDVIQWRSIDNPYFDKEEYYKEMQRLPQEEFDMKYGGKFTRLTGMVYDFNKYKHTIRREMLPNDYDIIVCGIDFGIAKPCGISVIGIRKGSYYVLDEFKRSGVEWEALAEKLMEFRDKYNISFYYADPEDPKAINFLRLQGLPVSEANNDVQGRLRSIRVLLGDGKFLISDHCEDTIKEIQTYSREIDSDGFYSEKPVKRNDHLMDAMGYAVYSHHYSEVDKIHKTVLNINELTMPHPLSTTDLGAYFTPKHMEDMFVAEYGEDALQTYYSMQTDPYHDYETFDY